MNTLIAYFSYTGHTKGIAQQIQDLTGGTLFEIRPLDAYSSDYDTTERQARKETREDYRPALAEQVSENDFSGKKIALFCTNGGGGLGHTVSNIQKLVKGTEMLDSLNLYEDGGADAKAKIEAWLKKNGLY